MDYNSIKCNLSKDDIISDIKLCLGADINRINTYVIVEGIDDIRFIKKYISSNVLLYESFDGKNGVMEIVDTFFGVNKRVIGIRDKDYCTCLGSAKIHYYDYSCMEMMLIDNEDTFNAIFCEYYAGDKEANLLMMYLLSELQFLSCIRMCNETDGWGILLDGVSIVNAFDAIGFKVDHSILINKVNSMNRGFLDASKILYLKSKFVESPTIKYLLGITQGHDFIKLFATICNLYTKNGVNVKDIAASLRCAYKKEYFICTNLYTTLNDYQKSNNLNILSA